jgi:hypothetical protein
VPLLKREHEELAIREGLHQAGRRASGAFGPSDIQDGLPLLNEILGQFLALFGSGAYPQHASFYEAYLLCHEVVAFAQGDPGGVLGYLVLLQRG